MTSNPLPLLPNLPPELRNEIYAYVSTPESGSSPTNTQLPLQLKTFSCKHTTVQICPTYHGSAGLLALPKVDFLEVREYHSWLLNNAVELRIGVHFKGRINTFVQADWSKKMEAHLRKLAKLHPWLKKVATYEIQMLWNAPDGALKSKNNKRIAGQVPLDMVKTLTLLMDADVKRKRGDVRVGLHLDHRYAVGNAISDVKFGLDRFLADEEHGFQIFTKEVRKAPPSYTLTPPPLEGFLVIASALDEEKVLLEVKEGAVTWSERTKGQLVTKKTAGSLVQAGDLKQEDNIGSAFLMRNLVAECLGRR
jgi:hypothetical protein